MKTAHDFAPAAPGASRPVIAPETSAMEEYLGPVHGRYFGSGYKRVDREMSNITVVAGADFSGQATATAQLYYPKDWSRKATSEELRPHLSTIDAFLLAVDLAEVYLADGHGLNAARRRQAWIRAMSIRAGSAPDETLTGLGASLAVATTRGESDPNHATSSFRCRVGSIKVQLMVEHPVADVGGPVRTVHDRADEVLGSKRSRYFGDGYKLRNQRFADVRVHDEGPAIDATVQVGTDDVFGRDDGLGGAYGPSVSMLDCLLSLAQLAQVLVYRHDGIPRTDSNTLWMRRLSLETRSPHHQLSDPMRAVVSVDRASLLHLGGGTWRAFEMSGSIAGVVGTSSFAHQLPEIVERNVA
jgi:Pseudomonas avirulence D protein (AvrD)